MDTEQKPAAQIAALIATLVALLALLDAAIETVIGGLPVRWWVAPPAVALVAVVVLLWRPGGPLARRFGWTGAAVTTIGGLGVLVAASAWGPGGLENGIRIAGQPTSVVLSALSLCAIALSAAVTLGARSLPIWFRLGVAALAAYAATAFVLGLVRATPYPALFSGAGFWTSVPAWLQGPFVGAVVVLPLGAVALVVAWLKSRRGCGRATRVAQASRPVDRGVRREPGGHPGRRRRLGDLLDLDRCRRRGAERLGRRARCPWRRARCRRRRPRLPLAGDTRGAGGHRGGAAIGDRARGRSVPAGPAAGRRTARQPDRPRRGAREDWARSGGA